MSNRLEHLRQVNEDPVFSVFDEEFCTYGRIIEGYELSELTNYMEQHTGIPEDGNVYQASITEMEQLQAAEEIENTVYGGMPIQIGYCNGRNSTINGFEYHKGSEINLAITDLVLFLGHTWQIAEDHTYQVTDGKFFFVPHGTMIEMYQTTLHLSPLKVTDEGFKAVVILPRGTNTPLTERIGLPSGENVLLLEKNKWVIAHPNREPLIKKGAFPGLIGPNKELRYQ